ncbi:hypothetical protein V5799_023818 [Amblyomma americanum]|uniref:Secreted protein n=1 Tax=Amblyomma americanum TaxID=6943 RepID=A0AAQ4FHZ4_AMBAM
MRALTLTLFLAVLYLALLLPKQAAAQDTTAATSTARPPSKPREKGIAKHICKGTEKFTNTINLLLTFGKKVLEDPRPLRVGEDLGLNVTLNDLDTLSLRGKPETFCNESVAEAFLPLRLSPSIVLHRRRSLLYAPNTERNVSYTLSGLEMDVGVRVDRTDPERHVTISSLDIVTLRYQRKQPCKRGWPICPQRRTSGVAASSSEQTPRRRVRRQWRFICRSDDSFTQLMRSIMEVNRQLLQSTEPLRVGDSENLGLVWLRNGRVYNLHTVRVAVSLPFTLYTWTQYRL